MPFAQGVGQMSIQEALLIIEMADHDSVTAIDFIEALETVGGEAWSIN